MKTGDLRIARRAKVLMNLNREERKGREKKGKM